MTASEPDEICVRVRVPGKLNLHLAVGERRDDGYHNLVTIFHAVDVVDEVRACQADRLEIHVTGEGADDVPADQRNLAWQAASLLARNAGVAPHVRLSITKAIPVAAGMAGGSVDAAAALVACEELWQLGWDRTDLERLAPTLGSDVTFGLVGGTALGTGRGEHLAPILTTGTFHWVLAVSDAQISAGAAYAEFDRQRASGSGRADLPAPERVIDALREGSAEHLAATLGNDLQAAAVALCPELEQTLAAGREAGALAALVSGSGPTCAFLAADRAAAQQLADRLQESAVCRDVLVATGPAPGARVVR